MQEASAEWARRQYELAEMEMLMEKKIREKITSQIIEESHNFGSDDNPIRLTKHMKRYLLDVYKWYYKNDIDTSPYADNLDINKIYRIIVKGYYRKEHKEFLNDIKMVVLKIEVDMKADKARVEEDDLPF